MHNKASVQAKKIPIKRTLVVHNRHPNNGKIYQIQQTHLLGGYEFDSRICSHVRG